MPFSIFWALFKPKKAVVPQIRIWAWELRTQPKVDSLGGSFGSPVIMKLCFQLFKPWTPHPCLRDRLIDIDRKMTDRLKGDNRLNGINLLTLHNDCKENHSLIFIYPRPDLGPMVSPGSSHPAIVNRPPQAIFMIQ